MDEIISSFGIDWKLFLSESVNFLIVILVLYFFVFKRIFKILDERKEKIADGIFKSEEAVEILKDAENKRSEIIAESRMEASEKIKKAVESGKEKSDDILTEAKEKSEKIIQDSKDKGESEKGRIISSADKEIAKMAILGAEKILNEK